MSPLDPSRLLLMGLRPAAPKESQERAEGVGSVGGTFVDFAVRPTELEIFRLLHFTSMHVYDVLKRPVTPDALSQKQHTQRTRILVRPISTPDCLGRGF